MACELCGGDDLWVKTCLTPEGSRLLVCDPFHVEHTSVLTIVIVPGDLVVTAGCDLCGVYGTPREFSGLETRWQEGRLLGGNRRVRGEGVMIKRLVSRACAALPDAG